MKKLIFYFILASLLSMLIGSGFNAVFKDVEIGKDHFEAGTLEIELTEKGSAEGVSGFSLGDSTNYSIEVKNISSLPLKYLVNVYPHGDLGEYISVNIPQPGYLQPDEMDLIQIPVQLPQDAGVESEGKNGWLEIVVQAFQEGYPDGFSDEKMLEKDVFSSSQLPEVKILSPSAGEKLSGTVLITAQAYDDFGIKNVMFYLDSILSGGTGMTSTSPGEYELSWNAETIPPGTHYLIVEAEDGTGQKTSDTVEIIIGGQE
jgi:hypothetical protein